MTTKEKIQAAALTLFNEIGVEKVTTRKVAAQIGISQGNLHYHYPNIETLILVLYEQFKLGARERQYLQSGQLNPELLWQSLHVNFNWMYEHRFLFQDRDVVWRKLPQIEQETQKLIEVKSEEMKGLLSLGKKDGLFVSTSIQQEKMFVQQLVLFINSWTDGVALFGESHAEPPKYYAKMVFRMFIPYLKVPHQKPWETFIQEQ